MEKAWTAPVAKRDPPCKSCTDEDDQRRVARKTRRCSMGNKHDVSDDVSFWKPRLRNPALTVRVGTDCSGLDTVIGCFEDLNVHVQHVFSSELNDKLRNFISARFSPNTIYPDMKARDNNAVWPEGTDLDYYVVGLACQPFSRAGKNRGMQDTAEHGRGDLFFDALDFIEKRLPRVFIIENVENLVRRHSQAFQLWLRALGELQVYMVDWRLMNTYEHGIPQRRQRVYIVGIRLDVMKHPWTWPDPVAPVKLDTLLDPVGSPDTENPFTARSSTKTFSKHWKNNHE